MKRYIDIHENVCLKTHTGIEVSENPHDNSSIPSSSSTTVKKYVVGVATTRTRTQNNSTASFFDEQQQAQQHEETQQHQVISLLSIHYFLSPYLIFHFFHFFRVCLGIFSL